MKKAAKRKSKIKTDPNLSEEYKGKIFFPEKLDKATKHFEGRDINAEIKKALEKE